MGIPFMNMKNIELVEEDPATGKLITKKELDERRGKIEEKPNHLDDLIAIVEQKPKSLDELQKELTYELINEPFPNPKDATITSIGGDFEPTRPIPPKSQIIKEGAVPIHALADTWELLGEPDDELTRKQTTSVAKKILRFLNLD